MPRRIGRIAEAIGLPAGEILFLSDIVEELDAARAAGMQTTLLARAPARCPEVVRTSLRRRFRRDRYCTPNDATDRAART